MKFIKFGKECLFAVLLLSVEDVKMFYANSAA